ncbi:MAG: TlpA family protein disulfide reductase [Gemmatimonadetes bacterium]|nr:TlpA family protein disulfide reductase [Gemmatimonadota bacterium]
MHTLKQKLSRPALALLIIAVTAFVPGTAFAQPKVAAEIGRDAPDFTLVNLAGEEVNLYEELESGPVLLDFWALWCKPCLRALPGTNKLYAEFKDRGFTVLTINTDSPRSTAKVKPYVKSKGYDFEVLMDPNRSLQRLYRFSQIPKVYLIDQDRKIAYAQLGYSTELEKRLHGEVAKLMPAAAPESEEAMDADHEEGTN